MPKGKWDWMIFTLLAVYLTYTFWGDMGGFIATTVYGSIIYFGYLSTKWIGRKVKCYG